MISYISLAEYLYIAEQATGLSAAVLAKASRIDLADSALNAPRASFGGQEFYPALADKAAVLACRLAWNHPLPDGNKRSAWISLIEFLDRNGAAWIAGSPAAEEAVAVMVATAGHQVDEQWVSAWLRQRVGFP